LAKNAGILKYINYFLFTIIAATVIISVFTAQGQMAYGIQAVGKEYGITIHPEGQLFNISGLAPGEEFSTTLKVTNNGQHRFTYDIKVADGDNSNLLYTALDLKIKKDQNTLYDGKLRDLETVLGTLEPGKEETLDFTLGLPLESGREYEAQTTNFNLIISATVFESSAPSGQENIQ